MLAAVAGALALAAGPVAARSKPKEEKPLIGTPQVVQDLHWGDVLFYFYQGDYLQSLTRLGAAQDFDRVDASRGRSGAAQGRLVSCRSASTRRPAASSSALLNDNVPLDVRNRAWFYLAKVWYQRDYLEDSPPMRWLRFAARCRATWSPSVTCWKRRC